MSMHGGRVPWGDKTKEFHGHKKKVHSVAWNMDGKRLASGSVDKTARVWAVEDHQHGKDVELRGHTDSVDQLTWNPTHPDQLATACGDKTVRIWDVRTGKESHRINTPGENINVTWSPDGKQIVVGNRSDELCFIDCKMPSPDLVKSMTQKFQYEVNEIAYHPTGEYLFITTGNGTIEVLKCPTMTPYRKQFAHTANCYCVDFDPQGRFLCVGAADAIVSLWDSSELMCLRTFTNLQWAVRALSINHDGQVIAMASEDTFIDICNTETGEQVDKVDVKYAINTIAWHPTQNLLAYAGDEKDRDDRDVGSVKVYGYRSRDL